MRGLGLMIGVEFHGAAGAWSQGLRERGILATKAGDKVLRLLPPLVVKRRRSRLFLASLERAAGEAARARPPGPVPVEAGQSAAER